MIVMNNQPIEQVQSFTFLDYKLTHLIEEDTDWKIIQFHMHETIKRAIEKISKIRITTL